MTKKTVKNNSFPFAFSILTPDSFVSGHPLSIDGGVIMFCESGKAEFTINSNKYFMTSEKMAFIVFDMVVVPTWQSVDFKAKFVSMDFDSAQDNFFIVTSNRFWDFVYKSPVFVVPEDMVGIIRHWLSIMEWIYFNCPDMEREIVMRNGMENFILIMAEQVEARLGALGENPSKNRAWTLVNDFIGLINRHYASHHDVVFYADKLNITSNYLNIITKKNSGISAKEQINIQIIIVVKALLDTTDLSVKQISERLHYDDPSYLCRIFRKQTGMSPLQYRNKLRSNS